MLKLKTNMIHLEMFHITALIVENCILYTNKNMYINYRLL